MKKLIAESVCFILGLCLLFSLCAFLSHCAADRIGYAKELISSLPPGYAEQGDARERAKEIARRAEEQLKKAEDPLAFFVRYDDLNRTQICAEAFSASLLGDERSEIERSLRALREALDSLLRLNELSLEIFF